MPARRPGIVTFVVILTFINAAVYAVGSLVAFFLYAADATAEDIGLDEQTLLITGISYALVAIAVLLVGVSLSKGSPNARALVAALMGVSIVVSLAVMILHHTSAYIGAGLGQILFALFILWSLYGNDKAHDFFEGIELEA